MGKKAVIIGGVIVVAAAGLLILPRALRPKEEAEAVAPPVVRTEQAQIGTVEVSTGLIGSVEPSDVVYIIPKAAGEVTNVYVKPGDVVAEGQLLCDIDTKQVDGAKINLDAAAIALQDAQTNLARMEVLYASGDISAQSFEQVQSAVKSAQLQYDGAKLTYDIQMENSHITAPIAGVVESVDMEVRDMVSQQNLICVIAGQGGKSVSFAVTERVAEEISEGDEIRIEKNGSEYAGTITQVSYVVDQATGLFKVKASVPEGDALATGTSVKLYVTSEKAENAMLLPTDTLYYENGESFVYVYDQGTVHKKPVETGVQDESQVEILSGITMDDMVITTWSPELYEGAPAELAEETAAETTAETTAETAAETAAETTAQTETQAQ